MQRDLRHALRDPDDQPRVASHVHLLGVLISQFYLEVQFLLRDELRVRKHDHRKLNIGIRVRGGFRHHELPLSAVL